MHRFKYYPGDFYAFCVYSYIILHNQGLFMQKIFGSRGFYRRKFLGECLRTMLPLTLSLYIRRLRWGTPLRFPPPKPPETLKFQPFLLFFFSTYHYMVGGGYSISSDNVNYVTCYYHCIRGCNRCNYWDESISSSSVALSLSATIRVLF